MLKENPDRYDIRVRRLLAGLAVVNERRIQKKNRGKRHEQSKRYHSACQR